MKGDAMERRTMLEVYGQGNVYKDNKHKTLTSKNRICKRSLVGARGFAKRSEVPAAPAGSKGTLRIKDTQI